MPDFISVTASVVGFVEFALAVAKNAADFVRDVKDCPKEFNMLRLATYEFVIHVKRLTPTINKVEQTYKNEGK